LGPVSGAAQAAPGGSPGGRDDEVGLDCARGIDNRIISEILGQAYGDLGSPK
jgi:hypothetical protein